MAAKLRPRVMLPRSVSSTAPERLKPAAVSFSGLLGGGLSLEARQPAPNNGSKTISVQVVDAFTSPFFDVDEPGTFKLPKVASGRGPTALEARRYLACGHGPAVEAQHEE